MIGRRKRALVLGCGPAGLFAAMAFESRGWNVEIWSKKRKSHMYGAQYLHSPIPGLTSISGMVNYDLWGTVDDYRQKVYGEAQVEVSPETLLGQQVVWDIRAAYNNAYRIFEGRISDFNTIGPKFLRYTAPWKGFGFDMVVSSLPAGALCEDESHQFHGHKIWASGDAPDRGWMCPIRQPSMTVQCNGEESPAWYRASNIFNYCTAEWPEDKRPPINNLALVIKPTSTTCNCFPEIRRVGRYGAWKKGYLSDQAYKDIRRWIG